MAVLTTTPVVTRITCDKPDCKDFIVPSVDTPAYGRQIDALIKAYSWSVWVSRGRRYYCPEHGPGKNTKMRKVT